MKHFIIRLIIPVLLFCHWAAGQQNGRIVFLVRDAEAPAGGSALAPPGQQRAQCLAETLKDAGITQIFVNETRSAQQTAEPLAKDLKVAPSVVPALQVATFVRNLLYGGRGNVLVVDNKESLATIIARLHAGSIQPIPGDDYSRLFIVSVAEGAAMPVATMRYCTAAAPAAKPAAPAPPKPAPARPAKAKPQAKKG